MSLNPLKVIADIFKPKQYGFFKHPKTLAFKSPHSPTIQQFSYRWLRYNCICPRCRDTQTARYTRTSFELPLDAFKLVTCTMLKDAVEFKWEDGHVGCVPLSQMEEIGGVRSTGTDLYAALGTKYLWNSFVPRDDVFDDSEQSYLPSSLNQAINKYGLAKINSVPLQDTDHVIQQVFSMLNLPLAVSADGICSGGFKHSIHSSIKTPHPNSLQFIAGKFDSIPCRNEYVYLMGDAADFSCSLCVENSVIGGQLKFIDGYAAAYRMKRSSLQTLMQTRVMFREGGRVSYKPVITVDRGTVKICYAATFMEMPVVASASELDRFFEALNEFEKVLDDPSIQISIDIKPGDLVIWDNRRLLSGRGSIYTAEGQRYIVSCRAAIKEEN